MIGFVIPAYQAPQDLKLCRECIEKQKIPFKKPYPIFNELGAYHIKDIFVHDNSIDNIYFTAAVNKGLRHFLYENDSQSKLNYICVINQDVFLEEDAMLKMLYVMESDPDIGIVCACMIPSDDCEICIDTGGLWCLPNGGSLTMSRIEVKPAPLLWATAACWLIRLEMVEEIGLLDENMVHFCSDVDYCYRARAAGWQVWRSDAIGIHRPKSMHLSEKMYLRRNKDMEYFIKKWCGGLFNELSFSWQQDLQEQEIVIYKRGERTVINGRKRRTKKS